VYNPKLELGAAYDEAVTHYLREKYVAHPPAAIVAAGNYAAEFMLRFRVGSFLTAPVVLLGLSQAELDALRPLPSDCVGVPVDYDYAGTIDQALTFHPAATRLLLVSGASEWDETDLVLWRAALAHVEPRITVEYLRGSTRVVLARLKALGSDAALAARLFQDGDGRRLRANRCGSWLTHRRRRYTVRSVRSSAPASWAAVPITPRWVSRRQQIVNKFWPVLHRRHCRCRHWLHRSCRSMAAGAGSASKTGYPPMPSEFQEPTFWRRMATALIGLVVILLQAGLIGGLLCERRLQRHGGRLEESERRMILAARTARLSNGRRRLRSGAMNGAAVNNASQLRTSVAQSHL
jgi:hypothetical protein